MPARDLLDGDYQRPPGLLVSAAGCLAVLAVFLGPPALLVWLVWRLAS